MITSSVTTRSAPPPQTEAARDFASFASATISYETPPAIAAGNEVAAQGSAVSKNPSSAQVNQAVKQINDAFAQKGQNLYASLEKDKETGIHVVKVLDKNTKEIVSQYPSKEIVAIAAAITQYQESKGQLLDTSA